MSFGCWVSRAVSGGAVAAFLAIAGFALLPPACGAQEHTANAAVSERSVRGHVENVPPGTDLVVLLLPVDVDGNTERTDLEGGADFVFDSVADGDYQLQLATPGGDVLHEELVSISGDNNVLVIRLPPASGADDAPAGTVSLRQLARKVPPKARKELQRAGAAFDKGDVGKSIAHLRKALQAYPDYLEARNNLAACYMRLNRIGPALAEFQQAHRLDPDAELVNANLSYVFYLLDRYAEAEAAARRALRSDPANSRARFILALSLKQQNGADGEALENLRRVASEFPQARLEEAEILVRQGHHNQAIRELQRYLRAAISAADRLRAESLLARLER